MFEARSEQRSGKNGTALKTFRIPKTLKYLLELEAKARGLSLNALASMIFTKFVQWDRYAARFGYVAITDETLKSLLDLADTEELASAAENLGAEVPKEAILFWFKKVEVDTFLSYVENVCRYGGQAQYECQQSAGDYTITLRHQLGIKWSNWLRHYFDGALRKMFGIAAQFEVIESEVICRFYVPRSSQDMRTAR